MNSSRGGQEKGRFGVLLNKQFWRDEEKVALGVFQCHLTPLEPGVPTGGLK